ncbi:MAG: ATP-binding protein [Spirochaetales bacterium]|nr:ATP-binding protein [Spirochaetales bacterium]
MRHGARLKRIIILPFFSIMAAGFAFIWLGYLDASRAALREAVSAIVRESSERVGEELSRRLDSAALAAGGNAAFLAVFPQTDEYARSIQNVFVSQLEVDTTIAIYSVGFANGDYLEAQRLQSGAVRVGRAGASTGHALVFKPVLEDGGFGPAGETVPGYDPRTRPWYRAALAAGGSAWSEPYTLYSNADPAIAVSLPIFVDNRIVGVTSATLRLGTLSEYLAGMEEARNGFMYVVDEEGLLIAASGASIVRADGTRARAHETEIPLAATLARAAQGVAEGVFLFAEDGVEYLGRAVPFSPAPGLDWTIVLAVEERAYASRLQEADERNFVLLAVFLGASLLAGWFVVDYVTKPIRALADSVDVFQPGVVVPPALAEFSNRNNELGRLSRSFLAMKTRLDESFLSLQANLDEKEVLLKEVHHRVKNNLQIVSSILSIQSGTLDDPGAKQAFNDCQDRIQAMALVHEEVYHTGSFVELDMRGYLRRISESLRYAGDSASRTVEIRLDIGDEASLSLEKAIPCGLIVNELVTNALKHAFTGKTHGLVTIAFGTGSSLCHLEVRDDGIGMDDTPARPDEKPGFAMAHEGIGSHLVHGLVSQLGGSMQRDAPPDGGTRVIVEFPV